ncbi:sensor histidine kinase [Geobacillus subterraneus]|uniref:sensor histidine kinase n=1 Tax=Geobacillus subterraneus TaxID=129338 RepID=UPI001612A7C9
MERLLLFYKLIVWGYAALGYISSEQRNESWFVLSSLIYFCLSLFASIIQNVRWKKGAALCSIVLVILSSAYVEPSFGLLLSLNGYELASFYIPRLWGIWVVLLAPIVWLGPSAAKLYGLVALFSLVSMTTAKRHLERMKQQEDRLDQLRSDLHRLTRSVNEYHQYIKQSEYMLQLEERNRLSQRIHDQIGHSLTGALIQMEASKRLMDGDREKAKQLLENAIHISKEGIEQIRMTLKQMKPTPEQMGINRVKLFIDEFSVQHHLPVPLVCKGDLDVITPIQWQVIYENIAEALTNAIKYAEATAIAVEIHVLNRVIKVEVKDNGKGATKIKKGLGIIGMEERAASVHGTVIVDGTNGFSVTTLLPIHE